MSVLTLRGVGASPGVASGIVVFDPDDAIRAQRAGEAVILIRNETSREDVPAIQAVAGVVATRGGLTGDAAIVARALRKPCAVSFSNVTAIYSQDLMRIARPGEPPLEVRRGRKVTLDGSKGTLTIDEAEQTASA